MLILLLPRWVLVPGNLLQLMVESMLISVSVESSDLLHLNYVAVVEESIFCDNLLF